MRASPAKQLQALLLWARGQKIVLSHVQLGGISVTVERDYLLSVPAGPPAPTERKPNILEQYAGPLAGALSGEAATEDKNEPTEEDE